MTVGQLDTNLRRFYAEARSKSGESYSKSSLLGFRHSFERYLNAPLLSRGLKLSSDPRFKKSNEMLNAQIVRLKRQGKENVTHKPAIESEDLMKLKTSPAIALRNPLALLRNVWFHVVLFLCWRGREGQRQLKKRSFKFEVDASGRIFVTMAHDKATKTIPEEWGMYPAARNWQECTKHLKRTTDTKLWSFTWPNSILSAMLSFSIRKRILHVSGIMTMKFGSTPDQLVPTNSTGWWKASARKRNSPKCTPTTASEPLQSPYGRMLVYGTAT